MLKKLDSLYHPGLSQSSRADCTKGLLPVHTFSTSSKKRLLKTASLNVEYLGEEAGRIEYLLNIVTRTYIVIFNERFNYGCVLGRLLSL